jgi:hypothetical protein
MRGCALQALSSEFVLLVERERRSHVRLCIAGIVIGVPLASGEGLAWNELVVLTHKGYNI